MQRTINPHTFTRRQMHAHIKLGNGHLDTFSPGIVQQHSEFRVQLCHTNRQKLKQKTLLGQVSFPMVCERACVLERLCIVLCACVAISVC